MESPLKSLFSDGDRFQKSYQLLMERCNRLQRMQHFFNNLLPDIMSSTINGKSQINVIGIGSGSGELDLDMLSALHLKNPNMMVDYEVVEPVAQQISKYKELVSQTPGFDYIKWNWNIMTVQEFEKDWKEKERTKKFDFIHMFDMLYHVKDRGSTVSFVQGLLNKNGKLLISLQLADNGWAKLEKTYGDRFIPAEVSYVVIEVIKQYLDSKGVSYQSYLLPSEIDITECFTEGNEEGELMIDYLTQVLNFKKSAPPELKAGVLELLHHPDCGVETNGKIMLKNDYEIIVVEQLS
ncbi:histamine N-methyltransferase-like isoform X1 [Antennarius striatus]|uniref:histamine N-methyltransferase-like isoform X1 n=1 Tax=Antennarius striatus TaxID=241820 RepID=UPI0035B24188